MFVFHSRSCHGQVSISAKRRGLAINISSVSLTILLLVLPATHTDYKPPKLNPLPSNWANIKDKCGDLWRPPAGHITLFPGSFVHQHIALPSLHPIKSGLSFLFLPPSFVHAGDTEHYPETIFRKYRDLSSVQCHPFFLWQRAVSLPYFKPGMNFRVGFFTWLLPALS